MRQRRLSPGVLVSSSAIRARETADEVANWSGFEGTLQLDPRLYLADPETIVDVVRWTSAEAERVLVVGHNPGMEELATRFSGLSKPILLPTTGLVHIRLKVDNWEELSLSSEGQLVHFWYPKEIGNS